MNVSLYLSHTKESGRFFLNAKKYVGLAIKFDLLCFTDLRLPAAGLTVSVTDDTSALMAFV
jgi:hypothetical protein